MPLVIFLCEILKIDMGWPIRSGMDRYTLSGERWQNWHIGYRLWTSRLSLYELLFGGRALNGYFVVQIQSPSLPNSSWLEADRFWSSISMVYSTVDDFKMSYFYRPPSVCLPADAIGRVDVC